MAKRGGKISPATEFKPGQSGNPNGRPKKLPELDKLLADVLGEEKDGLTAAEAILKALRMKAAKGDIRAAEVLLDRAYGKAKQITELNAEVNMAGKSKIKLPDGTEIEL
jgi:hypothetical protein